MPLPIIIIICIILFLLTVILLIKNKLVRLLAASLHITFYILLVITLLSLFIPVIFTKTAEFTLTQMGTLQSIQQIDKATSINNLIEPTEGVIDEVNSLIGWFNENFNINKESDSETSTDNSFIEIKKEDQGLLEQNLYPALVSLFATIFQFLIITVSISGMILIIYASYATSSITELQKLQSRVEELELRIVPSKQI